MTAKRQILDEKIMYSTSKLIYDESWPKRRQLRNSLTWKTVRGVHSAKRICQKQVPCEGLLLWWNPHGKHKKRSTA